MTYRFLNSSGGIDEAKVAVAVERKADELARWRGCPIEDCRAEAEALYRNVAKGEREAFLTDQAALPALAAGAFVAGILSAFVDREIYVVAPIKGPGIGTYERIAHANAEVHRIDREDRRAAYERCREIAASRAASPFLIAAE